MAKRLHDTNIWKNQRWFKKLSPIHKLVWIYLTDACDHAGIWSVDYGQLIDETALEEFDILSFIEVVNVDFDKLTGNKIVRERLKFIGTTTLWITGYVQFQYENKSRLVPPDVPAVKSALMILHGHRILEEAIEKGFISFSRDYNPSKELGTLPEPFQNPSRTLQNLSAPLQENVANTPLEPPEIQNFDRNNPSEPFRTLQNLSGGLNNPSKETQTIKDKDIYKDRDIGDKEEGEGEEKGGKGEPDVPPVSGSPPHPSKDFEFDDKTALPPLTLEAAERNQVSHTQQRNTEFILDQWKIFLVERMGDPPERKQHLKQLSDLTSYFLNFLRNKFPSANGTSGISNGGKQSGKKSGTSEARVDKLRNW